MHTDEAHHARRLTDISQTLLDLKWRLNPVEATALGVHSYDDTLGEFTPDAFDGLARGFRACRRELQTHVEPIRLSAEDYTDYRLAMSLASAAVIRLECLQDWERDPSMYPARAMWGIHVLLVEEAIPQEEKTRCMLSRLREAPGILQAARRNLTRASKLFTRIGMQTTDNSIEFLRQTMPLLAAAPSLGSEMTGAAEECISALEAYRAWLEDDLMPRARTEFAIGADLYEQLVFADHLLTYSPDSIVRLGQGALISTQDALEDVARRIDPSSTWQEIIHRLTHDHPSPDELLGVYRTAVAEARDFVRLRGLVTFPTTDLLDILPTPEFQRGMFPHVAYMPPPPFDTSGRRGHFWVTTVNESDSEEERERRLEGHSVYSIPITALHESYPGHHLQFSFCNDVDRPMRKQSVSHLFAEGWALYCEEMMYEQGFYTNPRVRLFQLKDSLHHACQALIDVGLQTGEMTFHGAVGLLVETARFDEASAVAEVRRHVGQPARAMTNTIGKLLILSIREEQKRRLGPRFDLTEFHDQLLSHGTVPTSIIAERFSHGVAASASEGGVRAA